MPGLVYPTVDDVIAYNALALSRFTVKKADRHEVRNSAAIKNAITASVAAPGDVYAKAAVLLTGFCQAHAYRERQPSHRAARHERLSADQ